MEFMVCTRDFVCIMAFCILEFVTLRTFVLWTLFMVYMVQGTLWFVLENCILDFEIMYLYILIL